MSAEKWNETQFERTDAGKNATVVTFMNVCKRGSFVNDNS
jgi:hypothetical protein